LIFRRRKPYCQVEPHKRPDPPLGTDKTMTPANDNQPRTPADHRAAVEAQPTVRQRPHVATSHLATRLARAGRRADLRMLQTFGGTAEAETWHQARGNLPETRGEMVFDRVHETRPSPDELAVLAAREAIRTRDTMGPITPTEWAAAFERTTRRDCRGHIVEWRGSDGKWRPVVELRRQIKGERRKTESARHAEANWHLQTPATGSFPETLPYAASKSDGKAYWRMRHATMCHSMLDANDNRRIEAVRLGVDGSTPFNTARAKAGLAEARRGPIAVAKGAEFVGGRVGANAGAAKAGVHGGHNAVEGRIIAAIDAPRIKASLGGHADVLETSLDGATAKEIAASNGWGAGRAGERRAVAAQDAALEALADVEHKLAA
jgi:hypothetical protein